MKRIFTVLLAVASFSAASLISAYPSGGQRKQDPKEFFDSCVSYYDKVVSKNWKDRAKAVEKIGKDAEAFDEPIVTWQLSVSGLTGKNLEREGLKAFMSTYGPRLEASRNPEFYKYGNCPDFIADGFRNDYEYVLWASVASRTYGHDREFMKGLLEDCLGGRYPEAAYLEYTGIPYGEGRMERLAEFDRKYAGKAVSLFSGKELLLAEKDRMKTSGEFIAFRKKCEDFERRRASYRGKEAAIAREADEIKRLIEELDSKSIRQSLDGDTVFVALRNLDGVEVTVLDGSGDAEKVLFRTRLENAGKSYYVYDTLKFTLPRMDDGSDCKVLCKNGKLESECVLSRKSVSLAKRTCGDGYAVYAADSRTGRPVVKADLEIRYKEETLKVIKDFVFDGFTSLDRETVDMIRKNDGYTYLSCSFRDEDGFLRESVPVAFYSHGGEFRKRPVSGDGRQVNARIYLDRAVYNPGDTVRFKTVVYESGFSGGMETVAAGTPVSVAVSDMQGNEVRTIELTANEFGSAAGEVLIPEELARNGRYSVSVTCGDRRLCTEYFLVGDFVLPNYEVQIDRDDTFRMPGDTVLVSGRVMSYSGHPLASASVTYSVTCADFSETGRVVPDADGSFEFSFVSLKTDHADYRVTVKVVDITGETAEASGYVRIYTRLYMDAEMEDEADGMIGLVRKESWREGWTESVSLMKGDIARVNFAVRGTVLRNVPKDISYRVLSDGKEIMSGNVLSGEDVIADLSSYPSGVYVIEARSSYMTAGGKEMEIGYRKNLVKVSDDDNVLNAKGIRHLFKKVEGDRIGVRFGTSDGPVWAVAELYDNEGNVLRSDRISLDGKAGRKGSLVSVDYEYLKEYPDAVTLQVLYFKDEDCVVYYTEFRRPEQSFSLPLEFVSFMDRSVPGGLAEFKVRTLPGVECLVSVFDKSTENLKGNAWRTVVRPSMPIKRNNIETWPGYSHLSERRASMEYINGGGVLMRSMASSKLMETESAVMVPDVEEVLDEAMAGAPAETPAPVQVRDDFRKTIAFLPFLRSDAEGNIEFSVVPSGKLSTYYVSLFAHDRLMRNAVLRREMLVTLPVKVSVVEPVFLYSGDIYRLKAAVSNISDKDVDGVVSLYVYDNADYRNSEPVCVMSCGIGVAPGMDGAAEFDVKVPEGSGTLGFKVVFSAEADGVPVSDGVFVKVPVLPSSQVLVESHSAVLPYGKDRDALTDSLEKAFVNVPATGAVYSEMSLWDMLLGSLPSKAEPVSENVLSLSEAYHVNSMLHALDSSSVGYGTLERLAQELRDSRNADGGFGWFKGMKSSPYITAVLLEQMYLASGCGNGLVTEADVAASVQYLDRAQFGDKAWGILSLQQYLHVRSMYASVPFGAELDRKELAAFRKEVKGYLMPKKDRGLKHDILGKARRASILLYMAEPSAEGLRKVWKTAPVKSLLRSAVADLESLAGYAVEHPSGGCYFPNAVMPFRGMLESELYAHSLLCGLFDRVVSEPVAGFSAAKALSIADGIRIWLMVQKESQNWESDPASLDAAVCVMRGSAKVKDTHIVTLTKKYMKPFVDIKASGNGFKVTRRYYRADGLGPSADCSDMEPLKEGDSLSVGDKILAVYEVWNQENRSFVKISAPRHAALRPVQQVSGIIGWTFRPRMSAGKMAFYPQGYRNVKADRTELYFDVLPEETTSFTELFHVTQSGVFTSPVITVESLYAPHYRANGEFEGCCGVRR